jgi:tetratricopeptide (TPR) repeat protein
MRTVRPCTVNRSHVSSCREASTACGRLHGAESLAMNVADGRERFVQMVAWGCVCVFLSLPYIRAQEVVEWGSKDADARAQVTLLRAPDAPDAGIEIEAPDLGTGRAQRGRQEYNLMDAAGHARPLAVVWEGSGRPTLLLARSLDPASPCFLYFGGGPGPTWHPLASLWCETRHHAGAVNLPGIGAADPSATLRAAWQSAAGQSEGAGFFEQIFLGGNPYGPPSFFLSHFSGYLAAHHQMLELFMNSTDASSVFIDGRPFASWTGPPSMNVFPGVVRGKFLPASDRPVRIDYYQAKGGGTMDPNMTLAWRNTEGILEPLPSTAFLHPGLASLSHFEARGGGPVPVPHVDFLSYLGHGGADLYEVRCAVTPDDVRGAEVTWRFSDGAVLRGTEATRVMSGLPGAQTVQVTAERGKASRQMTQRIGFYGAPPADAEGADGDARYLALLMQLEPSTLDAAMLRAALPLLVDAGSEAQVEAFASPWLARHPDPKDPLWMSAYAARARAAALVDVRKAAAQVAADGSGRSLHSGELEALELELLISGSRDLNFLPRVKQLVANLGPESGKLGLIRLGDLFRAAGDLRRAAEYYRAAQPADSTSGRDWPTEDEAYALTVEHLLQGGFRQEALDRFRRWELAHPMAKLTSSFPLLHARALELFGRWREALRELEAFDAARPASAYEIEVAFYRARALYELGDKERARELWRQLARDYPRSELAQPSLDWAAKS